MALRLDNPVRNIKLLLVVSFVLALSYGGAMVYATSKAGEAIQEASQPNTQVEQVKKHTEATSKSKSVEKSRKEAKPVKSVVGDPVYPVKSVELKPEVPTKSIEPKSEVPAKNVEKKSGVVEVEGGHIPFTYGNGVPGQPETYVDTVGECPFYEIAGAKGCVPPPDIKCNADWSKCEYIGV